MGDDKAIVLFDGHKLTGSLDLFVSRRNSDWSWKSAISERRSFFVKYAVSVMFTKRQQRTAKPIVELTTAGLPRLQRKRSSNLSESYSAEPR